MATADLITELNTDLSNAYAAIEENGGTVPENKNTNNLVSAIGSIEGGDPYDVPYFDGGDYGAVAFIKNDGSVGYYQFAKNNYYLLGQASYQTVGAIILIFSTGDILARFNIVAYSFGALSYPDNFPAGYLSNMPQLRRIYNLENTSLTGIGDSFLSDAFSFRGPLVLPPTLNTIGTSFLYNCHLFDQPLTIPQGVTSIGGSFLRDCDMFIGPLTVETAVPPSSSTGVLCVTKSSLGGVKEGAPEYAIGVTLQGAGAEAWKAALPNLTSSTGSYYRKLILAEEE